MADGEIDGVAELDFELVAEVDGLLLDDGLEVVVVDTEFELVEVGDEVAVMEGLDELLEEELYDGLPVEEGDDVGDLVIEADPDPDALIVEEPDGVDVSVFVAVGEFVMVELGVFEEDTDTVIDPEEEVDGLDEPVDVPLVLYVFEAVLDTVVDGLDECVIVEEGDAVFELVEVGLVDGVCVVVMEDVIVELSVADELPVLDTVDVPIEE